MCVAGFTLNLFLVWFQEADEFAKVHDYGVSIHMYALVLTLIIIIIMVIFAMPILTEL